MSDRSLRSRLRAALITGAAVLALAAVLAGVALTVMRERLDAITKTYFFAITEADSGHILLLDLQTAIEGYVKTGDEASLGLLSRVTGESPDPGAPDTGALLAHELGDDHALLQLRREAQDALDAWNTDHVQPLLAAVRAGGPDAVDDRQVAAEQAAFTDLERLVERYSTDLRAEREGANQDLRTWMDVTTASFVILVLGALVAGVLLWLFLRRWVTDPLSELAADTRRVTAGDAGHPVAERGVGEVRAVTRDIEDMRSQLVLLVEAARHSREELERSHAALEEQAEDLRRSNRDLEQFAYVASHDLQEPLRKVASFTQLLSTRYAGQLDERADQYIAFAVDGAKRMQRLINDLLGFSRVGRLGTEVTDVDLGAALRQVVADLEPTIEASGGRVEWDELPVVRGEAPLLTQLLANLVGNALKFRHPDRPPVVRVDARRVGAYWELSCTDNGIGIDPKYAERVFVIFQRLHPKDVYEGTGIGLALCKKIVEYHGGSIWIDLEIPEGTAVRWTLPADDDGGVARAHTLSPARAGHDEAHDGATGVDAEPGATPAGEETHG